MNIYLKKEIRGSIILQVLVFSTIAIVILGGLINFSSGSIISSKKTLLNEQALQIAESGIDYYRWHLSHAPNDFKDGTNNSGPYTHQFFDKDGNQIGSFVLQITPPQTGFSLVKIKSTGNLLEDSSISRSIEAQFAIPSFAKYAVISNNNLRFGESTEVFGPIHSNQGIRFDGLSHNLVSSSLPSYDDPDHFGAIEFGVHTHRDIPPQTGTNETFRPLEAPPNSISARNDIFEIGRLFPVPSVDFAGITSDLSSMKTKAQANSRYFPSSGVLGYYILLKNDDTFDLYKVNQLTTITTTCQNNSDIGQSGWGVWSIRSGNSAKTFVGNYSFPSDGIVFVEDNLWVDGNINTARLTIASGKFPDSPATRTSININNNLTYTNYDGSDVLGLIAQGNVNVGLVSEDNLRIDAALIAQNGRVGRYYYAQQCTPYDTRNSLTLYGMIASNQRYGFAYSGGGGYLTRNIRYDPNLLYGPPPSFPLTTDQYQIISWQEVK